MTLPPGRLRRRSVLRALGAAALRPLAPLGAAALLAGASPGGQAAEPELTAFDVSRDEDGVYLNYAVEFELGRAVDEALGKSVPIFFVAEAEIFRERWYWRNRRVANATRTMRVVFQPLTSTYRVTTGGGLSQNYATRGEAIAAVSRNARWKIADPGQIEEGTRHWLEFSYRLDTALLPRPMQIGVSGQSDWQLAVQRSQRIQ